MLRLANLPRPGKADDEPAGCKRTASVAADLAFEALHLTQGTLRCCRDSVDSCLVAVVRDQGQWAHHTLQLSLVETGGCLRHDAD